MPAATAAVLLGQVDHRASRWLPRSFHKLVDVVAAAAAFDEVVNAVALRDPGHGVAIAVCSSDS
jgi:hypothetical protein